MIFDVYSVGNPKFLIEIFNGLARLWSTNEVYLLLGSALILGLLWNSLKWSMDIEKEAFPVKPFLLSIIFVWGLLGPQSLVDVRVTSKRDHSFQEINNVPLLTAMGGWLITDTGTKLADLMSQAFTVVGVASAWEAMSPIQHFVRLDSVIDPSLCIPKGSDGSYDICKSMSNYIQDCFVRAEKIATGTVTPLPEALKSKPRELIKTMKVTHQSLFTRVFLNTNVKDGAIVPCTRAHSYLTEAFNDPALDNHIQKVAKNKGVDLEKAQTFLQQEYNQIHGAETASDIAKAQFAKHMLNDYLPSTDMGKQAAAMMFDSTYKRWWSNAAKKEMWMENAEVMQSFFESLVVFLTPIIGVVLAVSGKPLLAMGQYFAAWVFVQLWSVMLVLVNGFTAMAMAGRFVDSRDSGMNHFSLSSIDSSFATAESYISVAGMLYTFIPPVCIFILFRGVHALQGMAKTSMADAQMNTGAVSPNVASEMKDGKVRYNNHESTFNPNTGQYMHGDNSPSSSMSAMNLSSNVGSSTSASTQAMSQKVDQFKKDLSQARSDVWGTSNEGMFSEQTGNSGQIAVSSGKEMMNTLTNAVANAAGISFSEAQQYVASGALDGTLGSKFSPFGKGGNADDKNSSPSGFNVGGALKGSLGIDDKKAKQLQEKFDSTYGDQKSFSDKLSENLSRIEMTSDASSFTEKADFKQSLAHAETLGRAESGIESQQTAISNLATQNDSASISQKLEMRDIADQFRAHGVNDLAGWLEKQTGYDEVAKQFGGKEKLNEFLNNAEQQHFNERSVRGLDAGYEAKAEALNDLFSRLDKSSDNIGAEITESNFKGAVFDKLSSMGVVGAEKASSIEESRQATLEHVQIQQTNLDKELNQLKEDTKPLVDKNGNSVVEGASKTGVNTQLDINKTAAKEGIDTSELELKNVNPDGSINTSNLNDSTLTKPDTTLVNDPNNKVNKDAIDMTTGIIKGMTSVHEAIASAGTDTGSFNNLVSEAGTRPEYQSIIANDLSRDHIKGYDFIAGIHEQPSTNPYRELDIAASGESTNHAANSAIALLQNDKLMGMLLGDDGKPTELAQAYLGKGADVMAELNEWYQNREGTQFDHSSSVNYAENEGALAYSEAIGNGTVVQDANSNSPANTITHNDTVDVVQGMISGDSASQTWDKYGAENNNALSTNTMYGGYMQGVFNQAEHNQLVGNVRAHAEQIKPMMSEESYTQLTEKIESYSRFRPSY